ncbi:ThiF family adenylyltransferase [Actinokineospora enzanensis]|uniref:ThiF family adenylyltransferase n=1 Tax=Actinokineospora enzanensis TaxID=155975 RepID=UPI00037782C8|nr:ThiF family adenylyltransferase [Actinokineospora enzanensis]
MTNDTIRPRFRPGVAVLQRRAGELQIGLDPRRAVVVRDLPAPVAAAAARLTGGRTTAELLAGVGPPHREILADLLANLLGRGLVEDASGPGSPVPRRLAADTTVSAQRPSTAHPAERAGLGVYIHGSGRLAVAIACQLAAAGVGHVHVNARGRVAAEDVGAGLRPEDVGRARQPAAHDAVRRADDTVVTRRFSRARPHLALLTDALVPEPAVTAELVERGIPHLRVSARDGVGIVGPLVVPGVSSCLRCADHHRAHIDPCWPTVAGQLAGRSQLVDLSTVHTTAGVAAAQTLHALGWLRDPRVPTPSTWNTALEVDAFAAELDRRPWAPHPDCACGAAAHPSYRYLFPARSRRRRAVARGGRG